MEQKKKKKVSEFLLRLSFQCESRELGLGSGNESCVSAKLTTTQQVVGKEARQLLFSQQKDEEEGPGTTRQFPHPLQHTKNKYKKKEEGIFKKEEEEETGERRMNNNYLLPWWTLKKQLASPQR